MLIRFTKMHGAGNDFVIIDQRVVPLDLTTAQVVALADRRRGIGCDQLITLEPPRGDAGVFMRIRNPDGSDAGACGNATRCVADYLYRENHRPTQVVQTIAGILPATLGDHGNVTVDMGVALLGWQDIPLARTCDTLHLDLAAGPVSDPAAASMGNPHATFFVPDIARVPIADIGPILEHDPLFPQRANIGFAEVLAADRIRLRVWERGAGLTLACGSGACAALVNAARRGLTGRAATVIVDGGILHIEWRPNGHVLMAGPVATSYTGTIDLESLPA